MALQRRELDVALQNQRALGGGRLSLSSGAALPPPTSSSSGLDVLRRVQGLLSQGPSASSALTSPSSASSKGSMLPPPPPLPSSHDGNRNGGRDRDRWAREGGGGSGRDGRDGVRDDRQEDRRDDRKDSGRDGRGRDREPRDRRADDSSDRRCDMYAGCIDPTGSFHNRGPVRKEEQSLCLYSHQHLLHSSPIFMSPHLDTP